jgi:hypothetical protein
MTKFSEKQNGILSSEIPIFPNIPEILKMSIWDLLLIFVLSGVTQIFAQCLP